MGYDVWISILTLLFIATLLSNTKTWKISKSALIYQWTNKQDLYTIKPEITKKKNKIYIMLFVALYINWSKCISIIFFNFIHIYNLSSSLLFSTLSTHLCWSPTSASQHNIFFKEPTKPNSCYIFTCAFTDWHMGKRSTNTPQRNI